MCTVPSHVTFYESPLAVCTMFCLELHDVVKKDLSFTMWSVAPVSMIQLVGFC